MKSVENEQLHKEIDQQLQSHFGSTLDLVHPIKSTKKDDLILVDCEEVKNQISKQNGFLSINKQNELNYSLENPSIQSNSIHLLPP